MVVFSRFALAYLEQWLSSLAYLPTFLHSTGGSCTSVVDDEWAELTAEGTWDGHPILLNICIEKRKNNKLTTIPTGIGSITRLNTLDLTNNPLESLPVKELRKLQDLRQLFIMEKPEPTQEK